MKTSISADCLAIYRKTFGALSTQELKAIVEGRKPHKFSAETLEALRLLLAERQGGGRQEMELLKPRASEEKHISGADPWDENDEIQIRCRKCRKSFPPDLTSKNIHWPCPHCRAKNQNLIRHYRSIAILCVLNLIGVAVWMFSASNSWEIPLAVGDGILLLLTARAIYRSEAPWADRTVKVLIRVVFCSAFLFNVVVPLLWGVGVKNPEAAVFVVLPYVIGYAVVFPYLFWLEFAAWRCAVPRAAHESHAALLKPRAGEERHRSRSDSRRAATTRDMSLGAATQLSPGHGKWRLLAGIGAMCAVVVTVLALPATRDELSWLRVSKDESVADEQAYLDAWPEGRHAGEARARIQQQAWSAAVRLDSVEGFQSYLAAVPGGAHVAEAQARIEALQWQAAVDANDIRHLEGFLRDHPDSEHAGEARLQIDTLARQQALEAIQRIRRIRSGLSDIFVLEGAGGDGSGRDWQNACGSLKTALEDGLRPGARIHVATGLIQESVAIPDNIHLICGYGRNARGSMELNARLHRVWLMPPAQGSRRLTIGRGCQMSGLWLGLGTRSAIGPGTLRGLTARSQLRAQETGSPLAPGNNGYTFCASISGPANLELSGTEMKLELNEACQMEDYDPRARRVVSTTGGTAIYVERPGDVPARLDQAPF